MLELCYFFCCKQKTAYEMRISDWRSDVCSSDLPVPKAKRAMESRDRAAHRSENRVKIECSLWRQVAAWPANRVGKDRKSGVWGKSVSVRVDLGGRRIV